MGVQEFGDDGLKLGPITRAFAKLWIPLWFGQFRWSSAHHPAFATGLDQGGLGSLHFNAQNIKKWHSGKGELFTLDGKCQKNVLHRIEWLDLIWRSISLVRHIKASWCQLSKSAVGTATPFAIRCCMAHGTPSPKPAGTACHQRTGDHTVACGGSGCCLKNGAVCAPRDNFKMGKNDNNTLELYEMIQRYTPCPESSNLRLNSLFGHIDHDHCHSSEMNLLQSATNMCPFFPYIET